MTYSPTAQMITKGIEESGLTQREIADRVGFTHSSTLKMIEQGLTRVPLDRIPALAQTLGLDQSTLLLAAIAEYHPGIYEVLCDTLGLPLSQAEQGVVVMFRMAALKNDIELDEPFRKALEGLLELTEAAKMR
ncbi:helix-turn-helix transcriptional regulator [Sulfitobacter sp. HNIBRBA3233]|uniref:helix-turn-helix domain-containing protein n=1 Tax=Sulfitobacter marinivivus TaxID=3158558 RepID=UPI0032DE8860